MSSTQQPLHPYTVWFRYIFLPAVQVFFMGLLVLIGIELTAKYFMNYESSILLSTLGHGEYAFYAMIFVWCLLELVCFYFLFKKKAKRLQNIPDSFIPTSLSLSFFSFVLGLIPTVVLVIVLQGTLYN
jgi:hypothetical protein